MSLRLPAPDETEKLFQFFCRLCVRVTCFKKDRSQRRDSVDILPLFRNVLSCLGTKG